MTKKSNNKKCLMKKRKKKELCDRLLTEWEEMALVKSFVYIEIS